MSFCFRHKPKRKTVFLHSKTQNRPISESKTSNYSFYFNQFARNDLILADITLRHNLR